MSKISVLKTLSPNDVGSTGTHQSGLLVPKKLIDIGLFPRLSVSELNPRIRLKFDVVEEETIFYANYIYYNNRFFDGTRDEYRLTGTTSFFRESGLKSGDKVEISENGKGSYAIRGIRTNRIPMELSVESWELIYGGSK